MFINAETTIIDIGMWKKNKVEKVMIPKVTVRWRCFSVIALLDAPALWLIAHL